MASTSLSKPVQTDHPNHLEEPVGWDGRLPILANKSRAPFVYTHQERNVAI